MRKDFRNSDAVLGFLSKHLRDQVPSGLRQVGREGNLLGEDGLVEFGEVGALVGNGSADHGVEEDPEGPDVDAEATVSLISNNLRGQVGGGSALLLDELSLLHDPGDAEVAYLDSIFAVEEDVVELDVPVEHRPAVAVAQAEDYLLQQASSVLFGQLLVLLHVLKQVTATSILSHHQEVLWALKAFEQPDYVRVPDLVQYRHLLAHFLLRKFILQVRLINSLYRYVFPCELMYPQSDFSEGALADELNELVVVEGSWGHLAMLLNVGFVEFYDALAVFKYLLVDGNFAWLRDHAVAGLLRLKRWVNFLWQLSLLSRAASPLREPRPIALALGLLHFFLLYKL